MPLLSPVTTTAPVEPPTPPKPLPAPPPKAREYFTWTPEGGEALILSDFLPAGIMLGGDTADRAVIGLDMPPQEEFDTALPQGGELANGRRWGARPFVLPVVIHADTLDELDSYRQALMAAFNPTREGVFTVAYPNGTRRHLTARYSSGLDVAGAGRRGYPYIDTFDVTLKARDPFPYAETRTVAFSAGEQYQFYAPPGDPNVFYISSSATLGDTTVVIDGQVEVWPMWTLTGPMSTVTLRNRDTNKTLSLSPDLTAGQKLIIRTSRRTPTARKITNESGQNRWAEVVGLDHFPVMWSLQPGQNRVTVEAAGTSPASEIQLEYAPRYLAA